MPSLGSPLSSQACECYTGCPPALEPTSASDAVSGGCWAIIGILSVAVETLSEGETARELIRRSAARFHRASDGVSVCFRFVLGASSATGNRSAHLQRLHQESLRHGDIVQVDVPDGNCGAKAFAWFRYAARKYPAASWLGKADSDTFINLAALQEDLSALNSSSLSVVGQFNWAAAWEADVGRHLTGIRAALPVAGRPCGRVLLMHYHAPLFMADHARHVASRRRDLLSCNISAPGPAMGPYPYAVGPLYLLSGRLVRLAFVGSVARRFASRQHFECAAEDATVGYFLHHVGATHAVEYTLAHMSWTKLHNFDMYGTVSYAAGPAAPESVAVHFLKPNIYPKKLRLRFHLLWEWLWYATRSPVPRCWPLIRFSWRPAESLARCLDPAMWWLHLRRCSFASHFCRPSPWPASHWTIGKRELHEPVGGIWKTAPPQES